MINYLKEVIPGFFMLIVAFSYSIFFLVQQAFGLSTEAPLFQIYSGLLAIVVFCMFIMSKNQIDSSVVSSTIIVCALSIILFYVTRFFYPLPNPKYNVYFLSMGVRYVPAILAGTIMLKNDNYLESMEKALLPFALFYTIVLSRVVLSAKVGVNMADTFNIEGGMNYQTMSYYSVFAFGMTMYVISYGNFSKIIRYGLVGLAFLQIIMALMTGGRGAFVLAIVFGLYFSSKKFTFNNLISYGVFAVVAFFLFSSFFSNNALLEQGMNRIFRFFEDLNAVRNDNRWIRWGLAWDAFKESPIFGNGIGSVFYKVGFYSHNIFTDMLCEGGIILVGLFTSILLKFYKQSKYLIQMDNRHEMLLLIFLCSFVNLLFSGYYLSDSGIWFALAYILNKEPEDYLYEQTY